MGQPLIDYFPQYEGSNSVVLAGGTLTIYDASTTNLISLFSNLDLTITTVNPVTLDAAGMIPDIYYADGLSIKIEIRTADGSLFRTKDNLPAFGGPTAGVSVWASDQHYSKGEEVVHLGVRYFSNVDNNTGNTPVNASVQWTRIPFQGIWNTFTTYIATDRVIDPDTGILYIARAGTTGEAPATNVDKWANSSGIGLQTINIPAGGLNLPSATPAVINKTEITGWIVVTMDFKGVTENDIVQFEMQMPQSWDRGSLEVIYTVIPRTAVTDGTAVVFGIAATAFGEGDTIDSSPGTYTNTTIENITTLNTNYYSETVDLLVNSISTANSWVQFKIQRAQDDAADTITSLLGLRGLVIKYKTVASTDDA